MQKQSSLSEMLSKSPLRAGLAHVHVPNTPLGQLQCVESSMFFWTLVYLSSASLSATLWPMQKYSNLPETLKRSSLCAGPCINVPNIPLGRLECVQSSMFSLNPGTPERRFVERHIVALNAESQRYLIATEVLQVRPMLPLMLTAVHPCDLCIGKCKVYTARL